MELTLWAALFTLWQCTTALAPGATALARWAGRWTLARGPGWRVLSPWPGDPGLVLEGPGFELGGSRAFPLEPYPSDAAPEPLTGLELGPEPRIERAGRVLRVDGVGLLRASSEDLAEEQERRLRAALRSCRDAPGGLPAEIEAGFSLAALQSELREARRATRWLRIACELYFLLVFAAPLLLAFELGSEGAWLAVLPAIAAVHAAALAAFGLAQRRALPPARRRVDRLVSAALFPPALLRAPVELVASRLQGFHPATAAAALLDEEAFVRSLRSELGRLELRADPERSGAGADACGAWRRALREGLLSLCDQRGVDRDRVLAPQPSQPSAASYCPVCLDEFRVARGRCRGCGTTSIAYGAGAVAIASPAARA